VTTFDIVAKIALLNKDGLLIAMGSCPSDLTVSASFNQIPVYSKGKTTVGGGATARILHD
jgi:hypothetical protein